MTLLEVITYLGLGLLIAPLFAVGIFLLAMLGMAGVCVFVWICNSLWIGK